MVTSGHWFGVHNVANLIHLTIKTDYFSSHLEIFSAISPANSIIMKTHNPYSDLAQILFQYSWEHNIWFLSTFIDKYRTTIYWYFWNPLQNTTKERHSDHLFLFFSSHENAWLSSFWLSSWTWALNHFPSYEVPGYKRT